MKVKSGMNLDNNVSIREILLFLFLESEKIDTYVW